MELDESPATSRLDHLAELATSPSHATVLPPSSSSSNTSSASSPSNSRNSQYTHQSHPQQAQDDSQHRHQSHRSSSPSSSYMKDRASSPTAHHSRPHALQQLEAESGSNWSRSPFTPTTTHIFKRMAIHEVLEAPGRSHNHRDEDHSSPPYKRKGSPEDSFSDSPSNSRYVIRKDMSFSLGGRRSTCSLANSVIVGGLIGPP